MIWIKSGSRRRETFLSAIDAIVHFASFFLPALGLGAISATLAKLVWRGELRAVRWRRLAGWSSGAAAAVLVAGLVVFGRDGMMATYAGMIVASAVALMWAGFSARR
jgi:hypothetical protein